MMKKFISIFFFLISFSCLFAQINMEDSTVQVVAYWNKAEKQTYFLTNEKYQVNASDTLSKLYMQSQVDISILDSTSNSYTVEWAYSNYKIISDNEKLQTLLTELSKDIKIVIKTDEMGSFQEVVNWKEIGKEMKIMIKKMKKEYKKSPFVLNNLKQLEKKYATKSGIESTVIDEIHLFYVFHGVKYKLKETIEWQEKIPNIYFEGDFDAECVAYLDKLEPENNIFTLRMMREVNHEQIREATYRYLQEMAKKNNLTFSLKKEDLNNLSIDLSTVSVLHELGWPVFSSQVKTVISGTSISVDKISVEIQ